MIELKANLVKNTTIKIPAYKLYSNNEAKITPIVTNAPVANFTNAVTEPTAVPTMFPAINANLLIASLKIETTTANCNVAKAKKVTQSKTYLKAISMELPVITTAK